MKVLTKSMQSEIPKDSMIITRVVDPNSLKIGDDVTYLKSDKVTVTHRIVGIYENHADSGMRGFQTKGVNNGSPDADIVMANNIVGKVVFHNLFLGNALNFIRAQVIWIGIFAALLIGFIVAMRHFFKAKDKEPTPKMKTAPRYNKKRIAFPTV